MIVNVQFRFRSGLPLMAFDNVRSAAVGTSKVTPRTIGRLIQCSALVTRTAIPAKRKSRRRDAQLLSRTDRAQYPAGCHSVPQHRHSLGLRRKLNDRVHRWNDGEDCLVVGSLNDASFEHDYPLYSERPGDDLWEEIFNADAQIYGGWNVGNGGGRIRATAGVLDAVLPASDVLVFRRL
jgi:hypothetical protein